MDERPCFYVGEPNEGTTIKAFCQGKPLDLAHILTCAMDSCGEFAVIVYRAFWIWNSRGQNYWLDMIAGAFSRSEWESISKTFKTHWISNRQKKQSFFGVGRENPRSRAEGFLHGKPIDIAYSLADAMSRQIEFAAIVCQGWYSWGWNKKRRYRERIAELGIDPKWMSLSRTVCTRYDSQYLNFFPDKTERMLEQIEKVHKLLSDTDEFFERGMPGFVWTEDEKVQVRYFQELEKDRKAALFLDRSELGRKRMAKLAEKSVDVSELRKKNLDPDDEPPVLIA